MDKRIAVSARGPAKASAVAILLAASLALPGCSPVKQSAIQGSLSGEKSATTRLELAASDARLSVSGRVELETGGASVELFEPSGALAWKSEYLAGEGPSGFPVGPYERRGLSGTWILSVRGTAAEARGGYDLMLSNR